MLQTSAYVKLTEILMAEITEYMYLKDKWDCRMRDSNPPPYGDTRVFQPILVRCSDTQIAHEKLYNKIKINTRGIDDTFYLRQ